MSKKKRSERCTEYWYHLIGIQFIKNDDYILKFGNTTFLNDQNKSMCDTY